MKQIFLFSFFISFSFFGFAMDSDQEMQQLLGELQEAKRGIGLQQMIQVAQKLDQQRKESANDPTEETEEESKRRARRESLKDIREEISLYQEIQKKMEEEAEKQESGSDSEV